MNVITALRTLFQAEEAMAAYYRELARLFAEESGTKALFEQLEKDEQAHGRLVDFEMRLAVGNSAQFGDVELDTAELQATVENILGHMPRTGLPLEEALRFAYEMERSAAEAHSLTVLSDLSPKLGKLLSALDAGDRQHAQTLERFARSCGFEVHKEK